MNKPSLIKYLEKNLPNDLSQIDFSNFDTNAKSDLGIKALHYIAKKYTNKKYQITQEQLDYLIKEHIFDNDYSYAKRGGIDIISSLIILVTNTRTLNLSKTQWNYVLEQSRELFSVNFPNVHPLSLLLTCLPSKKLSSNFSISHFELVLNHSNIEDTNKSCYNNIIEYVSNQSKKEIAMLIYDKIFSVENKNNKLIESSLKIIDNKIEDEERVLQYIMSINDKNFFISCLKQSQETLQKLRNCEAIKIMREKYDLDASVDSFNGIKEVYKL